MWFNGEELIEKQTVQPPGAQKTIYIPPKATHLRATSGNWRINVYAVIANTGGTTADDHKAKRYSFHGPKWHIVHSRSGTQLSSLRIIR